MEHDSSVQQTASRMPSDGSLFHHTVEAMAAAVFVFQGPNLTYVNPAVATITGYPRDELLAMDFWNVIHEDFRPLVKQRGIARQQGEAVPSRYEVKIVRKDGEIRWVDFCAGTIELNGERAVVGSAYDITDKKLAETEVRQAREDLERRVDERTAKLSAANSRMLAEVEQRQRTEKELRASRELFERFMEHSPSAAYIKDADGRYVFVNAQFERILKRPKSSWIGHTDFDVWPKEVAERFHTIDQTVLGENRPQENRAVVDQEDGTHHWLNVKFPVDAEDGRRLIGGIAVDITELRRIEEQLRKTSSELEAIFQAIPDLCFRFDADGTLLDCKAGDPSALFAAPEAFLGKRVDQVLPSDPGRRLRESIAHVCRTGDTVTLEYTLAISGENRAREARLLPFGDNEAIAVVRDITQRRNDETELRRQALVFENMQDGVILTDTAGRIVDWNPGAERMFGYAKEEVLGRTPEFLRNTKASTPTNADIDSSVRQQGRWAGEIEFVHKNGGVGTCETVVVPLRNAEGATIGTIGLNHDITERIRTARELRDAMEAAEAASRAKSAFLANISHEIRTPITAMLGAAELLADSEHAEMAPKEQIDMVLRNGRHLLALIDDLLDLSRAEAAKLCVNRVPCSLSDIIADVRAVARPLHRCRAVDFRILYETDVPDSIVTDATRLKQAIINLVNNALKFTLSGRVWVRIALERSADGPHLFIAVEDTGPGIADADTGKVFESFTQLGASGYQAARGAGLGLPLAKWIIEQLGGHLDVRSRVGEGSTFTLRVPTGPIGHTEWIAPGESAIAPHPGGNDRSGRSNVRLRGTILIAEDFADTRAIMAEALTKRGASVTAVDNGKAAVEHALAESFDLILMDIRMPELDGLQATAELRQRGYLAPIVALTASATPNDEQRLRKAGFDDRWDKPLTLDELIQNVAGYVPTEERPEAASSGKLSVSNNLTAAVADFTRTLPDRLAALAAAVEAGDTSSAHEQLHKLAGAGGIHGFMELSQEAARLLDLARTGALADRPAELTGLRRLIETISSGHGA